MKAIPYPSRWRRAARRRAEVVSTISEQIDDGPSEVSVWVTPRDVGKGTEVGLSRLCSEIEAAGFSVVRSSNPGPTRLGEIVVRQSRRHPTSSATHS
jgi:hypothetical protein